MPSRKGSPNKLKQALITRLEARFPEYNPVIDMAENAVAMQNEIRKVEIALEDPEFEGEVDLQKLNQMRALANEEHNRVAKYVTPQLKAVEVSGGAKMLIRVKDLSGGS